MELERRQASCSPISYAPPLVKLISPFCAGIKYYELKYLANTRMFFGSVMSSLCSGKNANTTKHIPLLPSNSKDDACIKLVICTVVGVVNLRGRENR